MPDLPTGDFSLTSSDLSGLANLVDGRPAFEGDDDTEGATGIRTLSGADNNDRNPSFGAADQPFLRLTSAHYGETDANGNRAINPIFSGLDARDISNILGVQDAGVSPSSVDASSLFMAFGQYFDHGLDFLPKNADFGVIEIGGPGAVRSPTADNPADLTRAEVLYIDENGVPQHRNMTSPFVDQNQAYGSNELVGQFLRESDGAQGVGVKLLGGEPDPSDPEFSLLPTLRNAIQHHWEANTIFHDASLPGGSAAFRDLMPGLVDASGRIDTVMTTQLASNFLGSGQPLILDANPFINLLDHFIAGDGRANENIALTSIHTIWARNHNFHAENLIEQGFQGSGEQIFQVAKMLNEADYQRVIFQEFADKLLGGLRNPDGSTSKHGWGGYNPDADARISHEFAAAAYRFGHSMVGDTLQVKETDGTTYDVRLYDAFLNPTDNPDAFPMPLPPGYEPAPGYSQHGVGSIISGTSTQLAEEIDVKIVDAIRNDLVRINADLFAFNVTRAWDVGLGTLNQVRADLAASADKYVSEAVGLAGDLTPYADFDDFQARNGLSDAVIAQFRQAYPDLVLSTLDQIDAFINANPHITLHDGANGTKVVKGIDRVDLWTGGLTEARINGGIVGQTFWVIIHEQLDRLQEGDRLYYLDRFDNFDFYQSFGEDTTFAEIVARTTSLTNIDGNLFDATDEGPGAANIIWNATPPTTGRNPIAGETLAVLTSDLAGGTISLGAGSDPRFALSAAGEVSTLANLVRNGVFRLEFEVSRGGKNFTETMVLRTGSNDADTIAGDQHDDIVYAGSGDDSVIGSIGHDALYGQHGADVIAGGIGNDILVGGRHADLVQGGIGNDMFLYAWGDGLDTLVGGGGQDTLVITGNAATQVLNVTLVNGTITGITNIAQITGIESIIADLGAGADRLQYAASTSAVTVDLDAGTATGFASITGLRDVFTTAHDDIIRLDDQASQVRSYDGNDTFVVAVDDVADVMNGGRHSDTADYSAYASDLTVVLSPSSTFVGGSGAALDQLIGFENFIGGSGDDSISGSTAHNRLSGGAGMDTLFGDRGIDIMTGGADADVFRFSAVNQSTNGNSDVITDFEDGDLIDLGGFDGSFGFVGTAGFAAGTHNQVRYLQSAGDTLVLIDTDNDAGAEATIRLTGLHVLDAGDFIL